MSQIDWINELAPRLASPARRLIAAIAGSESARITFQTYAAKGSPPEHPAARVLHGTITEHAAMLVTLNEAGLAVTWMINEGTGRGRTNADVVALRAGFVDCDAPLRVAPPVPPSAVVIGREGRPHLYFKLRKAENKSKFAGLQRLLAKFYSADSVVTDLARCGRLPGFRHWGDSGDAAKFAPAVIIAPEWSVDPTGLVSFREPNPSAAEDLPLEADFDFEVSPDVPEYSIGELVAAHGYSAADLTDAAVAETPVYDESRFPVEERLRRARAYVAAMPGAVEGQGGDAVTYAVACKLVRGFDLEPELAFPVMEEWNNRCVPPWEIAALERKLRLAESSADPLGHLLAADPRSSDMPVATSVESTAPKYVLPLGDFLSEPNDLTPSYWGDGLLDKANVLLLSGPMQVRKSWFVLQLALMLALGRSFLGFSIKEAVRVLLIECESSRTKYRERIRKVLRGLNVEHPPVDTFFVKQRQAPFPQIGPELELAIRESRAEVVILDTMNNFFDGDENSNTEIQGKVYKHLRAMSQKLDWQPSFVLVHHFSKTSRSGDTLPSRGAAMLEQAAGSVIHLERSGDFTKVLFSKVRDADPIPPMHLSFSDFVLTPVDHTPAPKVNEAELEHFRHCRDYAQQRMGEVTTGELAASLKKTFNLTPEMARKRPPAAAKKGYLKSIRKGVYVAGDLSDGNGIVLGKEAEFTTVR